MRIWFGLLGISAGLLGAAGVGLAAAGAHSSGGATATTAATFAMIHACAILGLLALAAGRSSRPLPLCAAATLIATGTLLFSGDLALRSLANLVLWHKAAPVGGSILILGWVVAAIAIPVAFARSGDGIPSGSRLG